TRFNGGMRRTGDPATEPGPEIAQTWRPDQIMGRSLCSQPMASSGARFLGLLLIQLGEILVRIREKLFAARFAAQQDSVLLALGIADTHRHRLAHAAERLARNSTNLLSLCERVEFLVGEADFGLSPSGVCGGAIFDGRARRLTAADEYGRREQSECGQTDLEHGNAFRGGSETVHYRVASAMARAM